MNTPVPDARGSLRSAPALLHMLASLLPLWAISAACAQTPAPALPPPEATELWEPAVKVVQAPAGQPPSDAIRLFDGTSTDAWVNTRAKAAAWQVIDGAFVSVTGAGNVRTKQSFGDIQLHVEFRTPATVTGEGQGRGNSGVLFMGRYELQILDSYENKTYVNGQAASIYKQHAPLVNASRPPGEWQSYDVVFLAPRFLPGGTLQQPGRMTVFHNGVLAQLNAEIQGTTVHRGPARYTAHAEREPLVLQFHSNAISFRNIWVRELTFPENKKQQ